jgi:hypothetical protein
MKEVVEDESSLEEESFGLWVPMRLYPPINFLSQGQLGRKEKGEREVGGGKRTRVKMEE